MKRLMFMMLALITITGQAQEKKQVIIDADTGNEVDDLYAVVRGLIVPDWEVLGLNATQWQVSHWTVDNTMENSYRLNQVLLSYLKLNGQVKSNRGATARLFDWGNKSQTSAASEFIADQAMQIEDEKLIVIALGALTNVASAILDHPEITDKIKLYWLGTSYNFNEGIMKNTDFNNIMDVQAVDVILNSDVELHIIPSNVAAAMTFDYQETEDKFAGKHDLLDFLLQRWFNHLDGGRRERTIWDLALIEAVIDPELATEVKIRTSKEKGDREVYYYQEIDADRMRQDFFESVLEYTEGLN